MQFGRPCRNALATSAKRSLSISRRAPALARAGVAGSRSSSSSTSSSAAGETPRGSSSAALAFLAGSILSGGLAYYLGSDASESHAASAADLNSQYGSPDDFKKAIEELKAAFPEEGTVTTDVEDLSEHGFSVNDHHPGASMMSGYCTVGLCARARVLHGSMAQAHRSDCILSDRVGAVCGGVPGLDRRRGEGGKDCGQVQDACHPVLGGYQSGGAFPRCTCFSVHSEVAS